MTRHAKIFAIAGILASLCCTIPSLAQPQAPAPAQPAFTALLSSGFKIAATVFVPGDANPDKNPSVVVTLQKDSSVAVCVFSLGGWENLRTTPRATDVNACDVRTP
jgi:hypothetical protein